MASRPAQNGSHVTDAGQPRIPVKAMGWGFTRLSRKTALARPVTGLLIRVDRRLLHARAFRAANGGRHDDYHIHSSAQRFRAAIGRDCATARSTATAAVVTATSSFLLTCPS